MVELRIVQRPECVEQVLNTWHDHFGDHHAWGLQGEEAPGRCLETDPALPDLALISKPLRFVPVFSRNCHSLS
jgi:hypothetical protein